MSLSLSTVARGEQDRSTSDTEKASGPRGNQGLSPLSLLPVNCSSCMSASCGRKRHSDNRRGLHEELAARPALRQCCVHRIEMPLRQPAPRIRLTSSLRLRGSRPADSRRCTGCRLVRQPPKLQDVAAERQHCFAAVQPALLLSGPRVDSRPEAKDLHRTDTARRRVAGKHRPDSRLRHSLRLLNARIASLRRVSDPAKATLG